MTAPLNILWEPSDDETLRCLQFIADHLLADVALLTALQERAHERVITAVEYHSTLLGTLAASAQLLSTAEATKARSFQTGSE